MTRSPAHAESPQDVASRWVREGLDHARSKPDGWAVQMVASLGLKATSYVHRWLTGEQQIPLRAIIASAESHPALVEHIARELAALVGHEVRRLESIDAPPRQLANVVREALDVVRQANEGEADGHLSPEDCARELIEWEELDRVRAARVAYLRAVKDGRGEVVALRRSK